MLEIIWKIIRGIHRWPVTGAQVTSVYRYTVPPRKGQSRNKAIVGFRYQTHDGQELQGNLGIDDYSEMYVLSVGDEFTLSYNPRRPKTYWSDIYGLGFGDKSLLVAGWVIGMVAILTLVLTSP